MTVKIKLHSLKIKDELQGRLSVAPSYLAVSVLKSEILSSDQFDSHGKEMSHDDDDSFTDALSEFISQTDGGYCLHNMDLDQQGIASDLESLEKGTPREVYYEAEGIDLSHFVSVCFTTRSSGSPDYDGIDTQVLSWALLTLNWSFWSVFMF